MGVTKKQQVEKSLASDVSVNSDVTLEKSLPKKNQMITFVRLVVSTIKKEKAISLHLSHRFMPVQMDI